MERVYVLMDVERTKLDLAMAALGEIPGVVRVDPVTGAHDLVVIVDGEDLPKLLGSVIRRLRDVDGVKATETLVAIKPPR
ncbi:MAG: Lrp/AsnC ligand binding domain-containing protein [Methanobacteriota archaeon]